MASLKKIWWIVCEVWHYVIYGTSVYIFYTDNIPGISCLRLHCFSCMGFFNCSYRKSSFAIQTQKKPPQILIRGPNSFAFLNWGSIKSFWKKKIQPKTLSRIFPTFIHYNHGSGGKNHLFDSPCNQIMCGTMSGDGSYYEVSNDQLQFWSFLLDKRLSVIREECW